jgi:tetratricopeptide (TPR) repeat protein
MIGLIIKSVLTLASLFFTIFLFYDGSWGWGIVFIFITALLGLFIFRNENLILAALQMRQQNIEKAQKYLNRIKQPEYLLKGQRAYFFYLKGIASGTTMSMGQVESLFRKALTIGLKRDHDQAMAKVNIAAICMQTGRRREAETLLNEAKKQDEKGMLTEHIKGLKKQMGRATSRNQMRMAQMNKGKRGKMR